MVPLDIRWNIFRERHEHRKTMRGHVTDSRVFAHMALARLLDDPAYADVSTVLDIGSGAGEHAHIMVARGKRVTALDYGKSIYFSRNPSQESIVADFNTHAFGTSFDCAWCSHVLEHQLDNHSFLRRTHEVIREGGVICVTVPPLRPRNLIVGGHVSFWNLGLLLYRLVLAGYDCREAIGLKYGYNLSVIVRKRTIDVSDLITYDAGDIEKIRHYLPDNLPYTRSKTDTPFPGNLTHVNWYRRGCY
jgi:SAM-dependent methyltransferase